MCTYMFVYNFNIIIISTVNYNKLKLVNEIRNEVIAWITIYLSKS